MSIDTFRGLVYNAALLLALGMIYDAMPIRNKGSLTSKFLTGLYLSGVTIAVMLSPWVLKPGIIFDTRSIVLSLTAFFFGLIPTAITVGTAVLFRIYLGGAGMYVGCSVIIASALCGYLLKRIHPYWRQDYSSLELYILGLLSSSVMILLMLFLPTNAYHAIQTIFFPVIIMYPVVTLVLGNFIRHRFSLTKEKNELIETKLLFNSLSASAAPLWMSDYDGKIIWVSLSWLEFRGRTLEQELGDGWQEGLHPDDRALLLSQNRPYFKAKKPFVEKQRFLDKNGEYRIISNSANPRFDHNRQFIGFIGICQDVTDIVIAEQVLVTSEQKYRSLAETITDLIVIHRIDGSVVFANQAALRFLGVDISKLHTINIMSYIHEDFRSLMETHAEQRRNGFTGSRLYNIDLIDCNQHRVPFEVSTSLVSNSKGEPELVAVLRDMTERNKEQLALKQSEEKYRSLIDSSTSAIATFDVNGNILFANKFAAATFGIDVEQLIGKNMADIFPPESANAQMEILRQVISSGKPQTTDAPSQVNAEVRWFHTSIVPIFDDNNIPSQVVINATDITQIKNAEILLRESEKRIRESQSRLQQFLDNIPGNAFIKDSDSRFVFINKHLKQLVGDDNWLGKTSFDILSPEEAQEVWDNDQLIKEVKAMQMTDKFEAPNGEVTYFDTVKFLIENSEGQPFIGGISLNATDRVLAQQEREHYAELLERSVKARTLELQAANAELEAYSLLIAHDLRAPLRAISGFANIIVEDYADKLDAEGLVLLNKICKNTNHMQNMIKSLLELAKLERSITSYRKIDMNEIVMNTIKDILGDTLHDQFEITVDPLPEVSADSSLMHQVWTNLLSNAVKFTMPKARKSIHVSSYLHDDKVVFFVRDSGVGFDSQFAERAFGVFNRLHKASEFEGTGIGLAIVKKVISLHQGEVWAESEPDVGSTFYFSLPLQETPQYTTSMNRK